MSDMGTLKADLQVHEYVNSIIVTLMALTYITHK